MMAQSLPPRAITPLEKPSSRGGKRHATLPASFLSRKETGARPSSKDQGRRTTSRNSKVRVAEFQGNTWKPQLTEFEKDLTEQFQRRLRRLGHQRVTELKQVLENPSGRVSPRGDGDTKDSVAVLSSVAFRPSASQLATRTCSLPRLNSKGSTLKGIASGGQRNSLSRVNTAPIGLKAPLAGRFANSGSGGGNMSSSRIDKLPLVDSLTLAISLKWGVEAADRHRLLVAAQEMAQQECSCAQNGQDFSLVDAYPYNCHLCERKHALNPKSKHEDLQEY